MYHLDDLWSEVRKDRDDVVFYAVNLQAEKSQIEKHWKKTKHQVIPVMQQDKQVSNAFGVSTYPTDYVIGPDGKVAYVGTGWNNFEKAMALESSIRATMAGTSAKEDDRLSQPTLGATRWSVWRSDCFIHFQPENAQSCFICHKGKWK
jgi:hypothetical protein